MEIACLDEEGKNHELERCKRIVGQDYTRICVRKALTAGPQSKEMERSIYNLSRLCRSGLEPREMSQKCFFGEQSILYLAMLQRVSGSESDARRTLTPYLVESCVMALDEDTNLSRTGLMSLISTLIAAKQTANTMWFVDRVQSQWGWLCAAGRTDADCEADAGICEYCLDYFCGNCFSHLPDTTSFCLQGHCLVKLSLIRQRKSLFRGEEVTVSQAVSQVLAESREFM
jgi:hypothetical protein